MSSWTFLLQTIILLRVAFHIDDFSYFGITLCVSEGLMTKKVVVSAKSELHVLFEQRTLISSRRTSAL